MQNCNLTITTSVDGVENTISRDGELFLSEFDVKLRYREENAFVYLMLNGNTAKIERVGDYTLKLHLEEGKITAGSIGIGGNDGEIETYAKKVSYSVSKNSLLLSLQYDLLISGDRQEMKLRLYAKLKE